MVGDGQVVSAGRGHEDGVVRSSRRPVKVSRPVGDAAAAAQDYGADLTGQFSGSRTDTCRRHRQITFDTYRRFVSTAVVEVGYRHGVVTGVVNGQGGVRAAVAPEVRSRPGYAAAPGVERKGQVIAVDRSRRCINSGNGLRGVHRNKLTGYGETAVLLIRYGD